MSVQTDLLCTSCAGQCAFDPQHGALLCDGCGTAHPITVDPDIDPTQELHYSPDTKHTEQTSLTNVDTHVCETCGGEVVFLGHALSTQCAYCDGPVVLKAQEASYQTLGLIPFRETEQSAQTAAIAWAKGRFAEPSNLGQIVSTGRVAGLNAPFWTFDSQKAINYMVTYRVKRGKNWTSRQYAGSMHKTFDDLLMPASPHITPLIRDGILHEFDPEALRPYAPAYLAGFAAERHHQSVSAGLRANEADKDLLIRNQIKRHSGKSGITNISYKTHTTGIRYRRILLPVWILHYTYRDKKMKIVTCGIHGRTFGERPFSIGKLIAWTALASSLIIAFGWIWGATGVI